MSATEPTAQDVARWARHAGLPLAVERHADVAAVAHHIHTVIGTLREVDFAETPPAAGYAFAAEVPDASV
ncbi:hypothetical protein AB0C96_03460 [Streptomyces sp. NPDC048506]|uniref:hypothetical protein n=1 Tax=Streptomyces sp. NPDC048506 TaxID=3155028 RepID=UPI00343B4BE9